MASVCGATSLLDVLDFSFNFSFTINTLKVNKSIEGLQVTEKNPKIKPRLFTVEKKGCQNHSTKMSSFSKMYNVHKVCWFIAKVTHIEALCRRWKKKT